MIATREAQAAHALWDLTAREAEVAQLAVNGYINHEIAVFLHLCDATIKWNLHKVFMKANVRNRVELTRHWILEVETRRGGESWQNTTDQDTTGAW